MTPTAPANQALHNAFPSGKSSDPLMNIQCHCDEQTVTLTGYVSRFYHLQMAIEAGRKLAEGRKLDVQIEVIPVRETKTAAELLEIVQANQLAVTPD